MELTTINKRRNIQRIITIAIIVLEAITLIIDYVCKSNIFWIFNIVYLVYIVGSIIFIFIKEESYFRKIMIRKLFLPLYISATIAIPYIIKTAYFPNTELELNELIQIYVSYLSFSSALVLGYVVYMNNLKKEESSLQKNAQILYDNLLDIDYWLIKIRDCVSVEKYVDIIDWKKYYYEIYTAIGRNADVIKSSLDRHYRMVEQLNRHIECGNTNDELQLIYQKYLDEELKRISAYNCLDMGFVILSIANPYMGKPKPWYDSKVVQREILRMKRQYENQIIQWIKYFLRINRMIECDTQIIEPLLYEWLLKQTEVSEWIKYPIDERKLMKLINEVILSINRKSNDLELCWGIISLRVEKTG